MNKKRIIFLSLTIVILFTFIIFLSNKSFNKEEITLEKDGVKYALTVDGKKAYKFPDKGYYNVKVKCDNARGKWLYDDWKLSIDNIVGNVTCNIKFTSSTKTNLNYYLTNLRDTKQGDGKFASYLYRSDASSHVAIAKTLYTSTSTSSFSWDTASLTWKSTNHTDSSQATISFKISTAGNYSFCYTQISEINSDYATLYKNDVEYISLKGKAASTKTCSSEFSVSTSDVFKVVYQKDGSVSYGDDQVTFSFSQKTSSGHYIIEYHSNYVGANPNNYIYFNDELWRIVGLFDNSTHGQSGKKLVKIVRSEPIGIYGYDKSNTNDWPNASLNQLLNNAYYNAQDGTSTTYCTAYWNLTANCDFTKIGIKDNYRNMIVNATWHLGGFISEDADKSEFFKTERQYAIADSGTVRSSTTTAYIGLLYPSDYGYSVDSNLCSSDTALASYNTSNCVGTSWLRGGSDEWLLTPDLTTSNRAYYLGASGGVDSTSANRARYIRPALYLNESVYVYAGDGSIENPYIIGM